MDRIPTSYEIKKQHEKEVKQAIACSCGAIILVATILILW